MTTHPNRSRGNRHAKSNPTPAEIKAAREHAGLTQAEAAARIYSTLSAWQRWESGVEWENGRKMHPALFELFLIKTDQATPTVREYLVATYS